MFWHLIQTSKAKNEKITLLDPSFIYNFSPKHLKKSCILGLKFVSDLAQVGEASCIALCNILEVNNNPLEDIS